MNPITHAEISWIIANIPQNITTRERGLIFLAGIICDLDGLGILFDINLYAKYHHILSHNLLFGIIISLIFPIFANKNKFLVGIFSFIAFHIHIICDLLGSGNWPIAYLWPFSKRFYYFKYHWGLFSWQNLLISIIAAFLILAIAIICKRTPLELISKNIDEKLIKIILKCF